MRYWKLSVYIFFSIISLPGVFHFVSLYTGKVFDLSLSGYLDKIEKQPFSIQSYLTGTYQVSFDAFLRNSLKPRCFLIKLYNQINYSLFNVSNRIIGKGKDIFEFQYIDAACGITGSTDFSMSENREKCQDFVIHLESIQDKLERCRKEFIFITSLSKASVDYDNIPFKYRCKKRKDFLSGYDCLKLLISRTGINYIDSRDCLGNKVYPAFYKSGIHWSRPVEQTVSKVIVERMIALSGKKIPELILQDLQSSKTPFWRDSDVFNLANIFEPPRDRVYFQYNVESSNQPFEKPKVLLQGGSFAEGFKKDYLVDFSDVFYYINYGNYVEGPGFFNAVNGRWDNVEMRKLLDNVEFIIVEVNEGVVSWFSNGFVEYLDSFLDTYVPSEDEGTQ